MKLFTLLVEMKVEGVLPERALLHLKRAGIPLYNARKTEKNVIIFRVKKKDVEKVFAIYPKVCYNESRGLYRVSKIGGVGLQKTADFFRRRAGVVLGMLAFCGVTLAADNLVLGVQFVGNTVYKREILQILEENGLREFAFYPEGREPMVTAKLLTLQGVEFCSVKKEGYWIRVETHVDPFTLPTVETESFQAARTGEIRALTVLRGTALKRVGESVVSGETLVGNWFVKADGERVRVQPIARVQIACRYAEMHTAEDEETAFAQGYLALALSEKDEITERQITKTEEGFLVEISYLVTQTINF